MDENLQSVLDVAEILDRLEVRWFLGGSLASSLHGIPRATLDADVVADLRSNDVRPLLESLRDNWYASEDAIRSAIEIRGSFNLIHFHTAMKVDIFVPRLRRFEAGQFSRVSRLPIGEGEEKTVPVCAAEDIVAAKLEWFRAGGEHSEKQWEDILGVLRLNVGVLDLELLRESASELEVRDLLEKALAEARAT